MLNQFTEYDVEILARDVFYCIEKINLLFKNNKELNSKKKYLLINLLEQNQLYFVFLEELKRFPKKIETVSYEKELKPIVNNCSVLKSLLNDK
jgi:hypothetical protein